MVCSAWCSAGNAALSENGQSVFGKICGTALKKMLGTVGQMPAHSICSDTFAWQETKRACEKDVKENGGTRKKGPEKEVDVPVKSA